MAASEVEGFSTHTPNREQEKETDAVRVSTEPRRGEEQVDDENQYLSGTKLVLLVGTVTVPMFLVLLDMSIIATAIPRITSDFHSLQDLGWYGSAYQLSCAALQPTTGKFYTYFSSKWMFFIFFGVFELGSLLCGVASSSKMLIIGRAVAGMGSSGIQNGVLTIISAALPLEKRPVVFGMIMGISQLGIVLGPLLGGAFTEYVSWRWCFYINLPVGGIVAFVLLFIKIPDQIVKSWNLPISSLILEKFDLGGFVLFAPAAIQLLLALQFGGTNFPWNSATIIGLFCGAGGTLIAFIFWEHRQGENAMIPLSLISQRTVWSSCLAMMSITSMTFAASYFLPVYFQAVKGVSPLLSGVYLLPSILSQLVLAVLSGIIVGKLGYYTPWGIFSGVVTAVGNGLLSLLAPNTSIAKWIGYQILLGAGRGAGIQMPIIAVQNTITNEQISIGMSTVMFSQILSGSIALTIANLIFDSSLRHEVPLYAPGVNPESLLAAGASGVRNILSTDQLAGVLKAYSISVDRVFYLAVGFSAVLFCASWGMGWKDIRKKPTTVDTET